jgi:hypothetical protein
MAAVRCAAGCCTCLSALVASAALTQSTGNAAEILTNGAKWYIIEILYCSSSDRSAGMCDSLPLYAVAATPVAPSHVVIVLTLRGFLRTSSDPHSNGSRRRSSAVGCLCVSFCAPCACGHTFVVASGTSEYLPKKGVYLSRLQERTSTNGKKRKQALDHKGNRKA